MIGHTLDLPDPGPQRHAAYRATREVVQSRNPQPDADLTVFVGLYEAVPYFATVTEQIAAQQLRRVRWMLVDNASSDSTWRLAKNWAATAPYDVTLVRNDFNLGATGSIFVNLDLVDTEWIAFLHQDDYYRSTHFGTLAAAAAAADPIVIGVFGDMARATADGTQIGSFPPPIWLVPSMDTPTVFLALVRNHCIPWPALAVRTAVMQQTEVPWHSTAFPDTELTLRMTARGTFMHLDVETMLYRDNMKSESRSIDDRERNFGASVSLTRVFASDEFALVASSIALDERSLFVAGLKSALFARLGHSERSYLVVVAAFERLATVWDNCEPSLLRELAALYRGLGAIATSQLLDRMSDSAGGGPAAPDSGIAAVISAREGAASLDDEVSGVVRRIYERVGFRIPYRLRKWSARTVIGFLTKNDPLSPWRFRWR